MMALEGRLQKIEPNGHMVPHGDRSQAVIEPWLTDQWYVDAKTLAQPALAAVREGKTRFVPKNWEKTYFEWLENIQPWCVSRQLWWGHQIPAWYGPNYRSDPTDMFVAETEEEAYAAARAKYLARRGACRRRSLECDSRVDPRAVSETCPRSRRARHLVLLRALAVLDARLARRRRRS